jgi:predicted nuclease of predicted toxin-antitoxin system
VKLLLDECLPRRLARLLPGHDVRTVQQMNWLGLSNGKLLDGAVDFDAFITVDKNLVRQQHLVGRRLSVIVLQAKSNRIDDLSPLVPELLLRIQQLNPGSIVHIP